MFAYTGWHLAHSIRKHAQLPWNDIHVQFTLEVSESVVDEFKRLGCSTHRLQRFGDGKYCNKLAQWENLRAVGADHYVFLDTDMICVDDFTSFLPPSAVAGKIVDLENPSLELLRHLFERAGFRDLPQIVGVEATDGKTFQGNCNGGLYSVPAEFAEQLFVAWRGHALALLDDVEALRTEGKASHVDQISFCMAVQTTKVPFAQLPSNCNYYIHFSGTHSLRDSARPLALLHYHNASVNVLGLLEPKGAVQPDEIAAVECANAQIRAHFHGRLFWEMRYLHFPQRGSGVGSRGANLEYKRALLKAEGAESAQSVLDVGCGDLDVVSALALQCYTGIDHSPAALARAAASRAEWTFVQAPAPQVPAADLVICFEVAIHQQTENDYRGLIDFLAEKTARTLIVSGYDQLTPAIVANHMLFFYEPLRLSLENTGRFSSIRNVGAHSDVVIYRCDV
jgi:hypothetical protein